MHVYPEFTGKRISEVWQGRKWLVEVLTPMVCINGKDYYVKKLLQCNDGRWFIPTRFFEWNQGLWAKGYAAAPSDVSIMSHTLCPSSSGLNGHLWQSGLVVDDNTTIINCAHFERPRPEIDSFLRGRNVFAGTVPTAYKIDGELIT